MSENKDAKERQIHLMFGVQLVTTVASGDCSLHCKRRSWQDSKNSLKYKPGVIMWLLIGRLDILVQGVHLWMHQ